MCNADNEFHNSTFKWNKDGVDVQIVPGMVFQISVFFCLKQKFIGLGNLRAVILSDGTLIIRNVIKSDSAWFECEANNGISAPAKAKAFLNVTCKYAYKQHTSF